MKHLIFPATVGAAIGGLWGLILYASVSPCSNPAGVCLTFADISYMKFHNPYYLPFITATIPIAVGLAVMLTYPLWLSWANAAFIRLADSLHKEDELLEEEQVE